MYDAGNNWAVGYNYYGSTYARDVTERVRREVENCDHFGGLLLLQSLAGGTGAGFGSKVAEELSECFPSSLRLSYAIWPYQSGEVTLQAYNTLLSVEKLLDACDAVIIVQNDDLHDTCVVRSGAYKATVNTIFLNRSIACTTSQHFIDVSVASGQRSCSTLGVPNNTSVCSLLNKASCNFCEHRIISVSSSPECGSRRKLGRFVERSQQSEADVQGP
jgi:hypothetical protein